MKPAMSTPTLAPTHSCFDDSLDLIDRIVQLHPWERPWAGLYLVHAICLIPGTGAPYAHAWVEVVPADAGGEGPAVCMFTLLHDGVREDFQADRAEFYRDMQVQDVTRYTIEEAASKNYRTNSYGPWEDRYYALCADVLRSKAEAAVKAAKKGKRKKARPARK